MIRLQYHTCAALVVGGFACWGYNVYGQVRYLTTMLRVLFFMLLMHTLAAVGPGRHQQPRHSNKNQCTRQQYHCGCRRWSCECWIFYCWVACGIIPKVLIACSTTPASALAVAG